MDGDEIRNIVVGVWFDSRQRGDEPVIGEAGPGYPILTKRGVTLHAWPAKIPAEPPTYAPEHVHGTAEELGLSYFFLEQRGRLVEGFSGEPSFSGKNTESFDRFAARHGEHFQGMQPQHALPAFI